jgi:hypothetical protein
MLKYYFNLWCKRIEFIKLSREYDTWCEIQEDLRNEAAYARNNGMDSSEWCWNCKYGDCEQEHN